MVVCARSPNLCSEWVPRLVCGGAGFDFERCPAFIGEFGLLLGTAARVGVDVEHGPSDGVGWRFGLAVRLRALVCYGNWTF